MQSREELEEAIKLGLINPKDIIAVNDVAYVYDEKEINNAIESAIFGLKQQELLPPPKASD